MHEDSATSSIKCRLSQNLWLWLVMPWTHAQTKHVAPYATPLRSPGASRSFGYIRYNHRRGFQPTVSLVHLSHVEFNSNLLRRFRLLFPSLLSFSTSASPLLALDSYSLFDPPPSLTPRVATVLEHLVRGSHRCYLSTTGNCRKARSVRYKIPPSRLLLLRIVPSPAMSNVEETELTHRMKGGAEPKISEAGIETDHSQRIQTHDGKNRLKVYLSLPPHVIYN